MGIRRCGVGVTKKQPLFLIAPKLHKGKKDGMKQLMELRLERDHTARVDEPDSAKTKVLAALSSLIARFELDQSLRGEGRQHILVHLADRRHSAGHQSGWQMDNRPPLCSLLR